MRPILEHCADLPAEHVAAETVILEEGKTSGRLFILVEGVVEVLRGDTTVAVVGEPGSVFGEMSVLLDAPHTASVRTVTAARVHAIDDAGAFLRANPDIAFYLARLLAQRLNGATTYLVDLKRQFADKADHLGMVGDVLESLISQQDDGIMPGSERQPDPRM